jgi:hypothetical protein
MEARIVKRDDSVTIAQPLPPLEGLVRDGLVVGGDSVQAGEHVGAITGFERIRQDDRVDDLGDSPILARRASATARRPGSGRRRAR